MENAFSFWEQEAFLADFDVAIIGGGLVGLMTAYQLKSQEPKLRVGVLEAGVFPSGASTKNAGFACFGSISELLDELETSTEAEVLEVVRLRYKGLGLLRTILGDQAIDYRAWGGFEIFKSGEEKMAERCLAKIGHFNSLLAPITGSHDTYQSATHKLAAWGFGGCSHAIENKLEGQLDTGKMMVKLLSLVQGLGVICIPTCRVKKVISVNSKQEIQGNLGTFSAKKVVFTTNAFTKDLRPELAVVPGRGQVLVTEPIPDLPFRGAFHYDRGYYYFRNIGNRILLGGGRNLDVKAEETCEFGLTDLVQHSLEDLLYSVLVPGKRPKITHRWSGIMAFGDELKPIISELSPGLFAAVRCNGMGVAMGSEMGRQVAELVLKQT